MYILGINYAAHDSSACLIEDGKIKFAIAEERLSRIKKDINFPVLSIKSALEYERIDFHQLDYIAFGWSKPSRTFRHNVWTAFNGNLPLTKRYISFFLRNFLRMSWQRGGCSKLEENFGKFNQKIIFIPHHLAHAVSTFYLSGFDKSNIIITDGRGAFEATSLWFGDKDEIKPVKTLCWPNSLGLLYSSFTDYLGFKKFHDEWKVMGLASYGQPSIVLDEFVRITNGGYKVNGRKLLGRYWGDLGMFEKKFGRKRGSEAEINEFHRNLASSLQYKTEEALLSILKVIIHRTKNRNLCLAGGVALNSKANGRLLSSEMIDNIFVQPAATDDGTAIGAALSIYNLIGKGIPRGKLKNVYFGNDYTNKQIETILNRSRIKFSYCPNIEEKTASLLADGSIIGWFQGRSEFGPRALGNRSILADPRDAEMKDKVNKSIKFREEWRPFAPAVLLEEFYNYFKAKQPSPFMTITFKVKKEVAQLIPAVVHVDGTSRIQTVEKSENIRFWNLIKCFYKITGVPLLLNTSFNLRGEPIVETPVDAIKTFYCSGLDYLVLGDYIIEK